MDGDEGLAGRDECAGVGAGGAGDVVAERVGGHDGEDADEDHDGFHDSGRDEAERGAFAVTPGDRVEGDGGDDASEGGEDLEHGAQRHAGVAAGTEHPVGLVEHVDPQSELDRDREDEGGDVGDAGDQRGLARGGHRRPARKR